MDPTEFFNYLSKMIIPFLPVLFGAVEFIKSKKNLSGPLVEWLAIGVFLLYGALSILSFFFPEWGLYFVNGFIFLLMCMLAPSGFYKFVSDRAAKIS